LGKIYVKSKNSQNLSNNRYIETNMPEVVFNLFTNYEENFQNILKRMFNSLLNGEITSLNETSHSFFILVIIYNTFYINLSNNLIVTNFGQDLNKQQK